MKVEDRETSSIGVAYETVREMILQGKLAPGSRLVERDLATHLGISRSPIRSVLLRLLQEGYLVASGNGKRARLSVAPLTKGDASELFSIVGFLDGLAASHAARQEAKVRESVVRELRALNAELEAIGDRSPFNAREFFDLDIQFHGCYVELLNASRTRSLYESFRPQAERYRIGYLNSLPDGYGSGVITEHERVIRAIEEGDAEAASEAAEANWREASRRICGLMDIAGERGAW